MSEIDLSEKIIATGRLSCEKNKIFVKGVSGINKKIKVWGDISYDDKKIIIPKENLPPYGLDPHIHPVSTLEEAFLAISPLQKEILKRLSWIPLPLMRTGEHFKGWKKHSLFQEMPLSLKPFPLSEDNLNDGDEETEAIKLNIEDFIEHIQHDDDIKLYLITGDAGIGKSTLLYALEAFFSRNTDLFPVRIPLNRLSGNEHYLPEKWYEELTEGVRSRDFRDLVGRFKRTDLIGVLKSVLESSEKEKVVMLDGFDEVSSEVVREVVKEVKKLGGVKTVIIAGRGYEEVKRRMREGLEGIYRNGEVMEVEVMGLKEENAMGLMEKVMEGDVIDVKGAVDCIVGRLRDSGNEWVMRYPLMVVGVGLMYKKLPEILDEGSLVDRWLKWSLEEGLIRNIRLSREEVGEVVEVILMVLGNWIYRVMRRKLSLERGVEVDDEVVWRDFEESVMRAANGVFRDMDKLGVGDKFVRVFETLGMGGIWEIVVESLRRGGIWTVVGGKRIWFNHLVFVEFLFGLGLAEMLRLIDEDDEEELKREIEFLMDIGMAREIGFMVWRLKEKGEIEKLSKYWGLIKKIDKIGRASGYWGIDVTRRLKIDCEDIRRLELWVEDDKYDECVREAINRLKSGNLDDRKWALELLIISAERGKFNDPSLIIPLLKDKNWLVRDSALMVLRILAERDKIDPSLITPLLKDEDRDVRDSALMVLRILAERDKIDPSLITPLLKDEDRDAIDSVLKALEILAERDKFNDPSLIIPLLKDEDGFVRDPALKVLRILAERDKFNDPSSITSLLKDEDENVRDLALKLLRVLAERDKFNNPSLIIPLLKDEGMYLKASASGILMVLAERGKFNDPSLITPLLKDEDSHVRASALDVLKILAERDKFNNPSLIIPLLKDEYYYVRYSALKVLRILAERDKFNDPSIIIPLLQNVNDIYLVRGISFGGDKNLSSIISLISPILYGVDFRDPALEVLRVLAEKGKFNDPSVIIPLLKDAHWRVKASALKVLRVLAEKGKFNDPHPIIPLLKDELDVQYLALQVLKVLAERDKFYDLSIIIPLLKEPAREIGFRSVSYTLVDYKHPALEVLEVLAEKDKSNDLSSILSLLNDKYWNVRYSALKLLRVLAKRDKFNNPSLIIPLLKDEYMYVKASAFEILMVLAERGKFNDPSLITPLLKDEDEAVRDSALRLLRILAERDKFNNLSSITPLLKDKSSGVINSALELLKILAQHSHNLIPHTPPQWVSYSVVTNAILNKDILSLYHLKLYLDHPEVSQLENILKNHPFNSEIYDLNNFKRAIKNVKLPIKHNLPLQPSKWNSQNVPKIQNICKNYKYLKTITTTIPKFWLTHKDILDIQTLEKLREWVSNLKGLKSLSGSIDKFFLNMLTERIEGLSEIERLIIGLQIYDKYKGLPADMKYVASARIGGVVVDENEAKKVVYEGRVSRIDWLDDIYIIPSMDGGRRRVSNASFERAIPMSRLWGDFLEGMVRGTLYGWRWGGGGNGYVIFLRVYADDDIKSLEGRSAELPFGLIGAILAQQAMRGTYS